MGKHIAQLKYKYGYEDRNITAEMTINLGRFDKQYGKAQYELDSMIMTDMIPYMPMQTGQFINVTRAMSAAIAGSGKVVAAAPPFGRYLYEGKVMVDAQTGKGPAKISTGPGEYVLRFRKGAKLKATDIPLQYFKGAHPKAQSHWFDAAKAENAKKWVKKTKQTAGGGR